MSAFLMSHNLNKNSTSQFDEETYNLLKTCRLCLNTNCDLVSLFDNVHLIDGQELLYSEMALQSASINIDRNDKLPNVICLECVERLNNSYEFRKLCENSERILHKFVDKFEDNYEFKDDIKTEPNNASNDFEKTFQIPKIEPDSPQSNPDNCLYKIENTFDETIKTEFIDTSTDCNTTDPFESVPSNLLLTKFNDNEICNKTQDINREFHVCDVCGKILSNSARSLRDHKRIHSGEKPYKCNECSTCFNQMSALRRHEKIHTGEDRPHKCEVCGKAFVRSGHLKEHKSIHLNQRLFGCKECGKAFNFKNVLKAHERIHTDEIPYMCKICSKQYRAKSAYYRHIKKCN